MDTIVNRKYKMSFGEWQDFFNWAIESGVFTGFGENMAFGETFVKQFFTEVSRNEH